MPIHHPNAGSRTWSAEAPRPPELDRLGFTGVEIVDAAGTRNYDYNSASIAFQAGKLADVLKPLPDVASVCSGEPAVLYRTRWAEIALTPGEAMRMAARALTPDEFGAICEAVGATWEMHDDFYDPETGVALDPKVEVPGSPEQAM